MVGYAGEDVGEPCLRVDVVKATGLYQRVRDRCPLTAAIGAAEQPRLAPKGHAAQRPFGGIVRETDPAVGEEAGERVPAAQHVVDGFGNVMVARDPGELRAEPFLEFGHQRSAEFVTDSEALGRALAIDVALDGEQGVELLHSLQSDREDDRRLLAAALLARGALDVGQLEELPARVGKASCLQDGPGLATDSVELGEPGIGVGLQDP